jgi:hypothetical protein
VGVCRKPKVLRTLRSALKKNICIPITYIELTLKIPGPILSLSRQGELNFAYKKSSYSAIPSNIVASISSDGPPPSARGRHRIFQFQTIPPLLQLRVRSVQLRSIFDTTNIHSVSFTASNKYTSSLHIIMIHIRYHQGIKIFVPQHPQNRHHFVARGSFAEPRFGVPLLGFLEQICSRYE